MVCLRIGLEDYVAVSRSGLCKECSVSVESKVE